VLSFTSSRVRIRFWAFGVQKISSRSRARVSAAADVCANNETFNEVPQLGQDLLREEVALLPKRFDVANDRAVCAVYLLVNQAQSSPPGLSKPRLGASLYRTPRSFSPRRCFDVFGAVELDCSMRRASVIALRTA
jgi:hypothetical protein